MGLLAAPVSAQQVSAGILPAVPAYNVTPGNLKKWRKAVARVRQNSAPAKLVCLGDSTTAGFGATGTTSWPYVLTQMLNAYFAPAGPGILTARSNVTDSRITIQAGWAYSGGVGPAGASYYGNAGAAGSAVFQPGINVDRADWWYYAGGGRGTLQTQVDSVNNTLVDATVGSAWTKTTISFAAGASRTISTLGPSGGDIYLLGVEPWLSTAANTIRVTNWGVSGSATGGWVTALGSLPALQTYAPDLTVIMLGINDALASVSEATYVANLTSIITTAKLSGDVVLMSVAPSNPANNPDPTAAQVGYQAAARSLSRTQGVPFVDVFARLASYSSGNAAGFYADNLHLNSLGYADIAQAVYKTITAV